jgi:hypothetical protein
MGLFFESEAGLAKNKLWFMQLKLAVKKATERKCNPETR